MDPRIAVITPYYQESIDVLRQCHLSVVNQSMQADHFFIADGKKNDEIDGWGVKHIALTEGHNDNGNTPRSIGALLAYSEGYDFIAFLDADNWFYQTHLESLYYLWKENKTPACCSFRTFHMNDGAMLDITEPAEDDLRHVDTSCYLLHKSIFKYNDIWHKMPRELGPICDRVFYIYLERNGVQFSYSRQRTVAFRTQYDYHYKLAGVESPRDVKTAQNTFFPVYRFLLTRAGLVKTVDQIGFWPDVRM